MTSHEWATLTVEAGLEQLEFYQTKGSSSIPEELEWEIKLYKWILANDKAVAYVNARTQGPGLSPRPKREVAASLGWNID